MIQDIKFSRKDPKHFFKTMRERVDAYFEEHNIGKKGSMELYVKTFVMLVLYGLPYLYMLFVQPSEGISIGLYFIMGFGLAGIGLTVMHDALHESYSQKAWVNKLMSHSMDLIGGSSFTWKIQHNILHHSYTNIYEMDEDIDDKPFLRLSPEGKINKYHKHQHKYAMVLYCFATISWILFKDFRQMRHYNSTGITEKYGFNKRREAIFLITNKAVYVFFLLILPVILGITWWAVLVGFVLMHMIAGLLITTIFQLAHVVEGPAHHGLPEENMMENSWAIHQLTTTANFATKNRIIGWFAGGLNFQIEHHLFPSISHIHYRKLSKIVKRTAQEFNLPYYEYPKFMEALQSHLRVLRNLGSGLTPA